MANLAELESLGIRLAIDDFGTGYAALSYLQRFPVDTLKIDRAYIAGLGAGTDERALVRAVISFAKMLDLSVTAEGVETEEQAERLRALGCEWPADARRSPPAATVRQSPAAPGAV